MPKEIILPIGDNQPNKNNEGSLFFIGNATLLIRYAGFTILTDPTFIHMHQKVDLGYGLKAKRLTNPAAEIKDLPKIDLIILSHFHGDHFDQVAVKELDKSLPIVTTNHSAKELHKRGFTNIQKLGKWESISFVKGNSKLSITSTPGRHGPLPISILMPNVMGSILDFQDSPQRMFRIYITGDTLVYNQIIEISKRFKDVNLALLHLGGTRIMGILVTMDAEQGTRMLNIINPKIAIPIHYNDYDVFKSPIEDFKNEVKKIGLEGRVKYLSHGDTYTFG
ncbi:MAG: MBL fold metallo-hydrolase [Thermoproteota archaeon]|nr:MBL fold metallo-hydrolase [Thermoproteota archaeon]